MASVNPHTRELVFKLVFYGPGLGGKTTTLQYIHAATKAEHRGKMVSLATPTDRTLYFDFLPIRVPRVRGMAVRLQLFTVPGQVYYAATRKLVLSGADGVVFVADSQNGRTDTNQEALDDLHANLAEHNRALEEVPHTFHWNKRDLSDLVAIDDLEKRFNKLGAPSLGTVATKGEGVFDGLERITRLVLKSYEKDPKVRIEASAAVPEEGIAQALRDLESKASDTREAPTKISAVVPESGTTGAPPPASQRDAASGSPRPPPVGSVPAAKGSSAWNRFTFPDPRGPGSSPVPLAVGSAPAASSGSGSAPPSSAGHAGRAASQGGAGSTPAVSSSGASGASGASGSSPAASGSSPAASGASGPAGSAPRGPSSGTFSLAELWPESDRESVRQAEAMIAARDAVNAVLACDVLVTRVLASAAGLVGTLDAPRDPAVVALLLGLDGARYLHFRTAVRAARHREAVTMRDAFEGLTLALEARRAREALRR